jgi:hypothetical protein
LALWIHKCGGTVRLSMGDNVTVVLVEMQKLKNMIETYTQWYAREVDSFGIEKSSSKVIDTSH